MGTVISVRRDEYPCARTRDVVRAGGQIVEVECAVLARYGLTLRLVDDDSRACERIPVQ